MLNFNGNKRKCSNLIFIYMYVIILINIGIIWLYLKENKVWEKCIELIMIL